MTSSEPHSHTPDRTSASAATTNAPLGPRGDGLTRRNGGLLHPKTKHSASALVSNSATDSRRARLRHSQPQQRGTVTVNFVPDQLRMIDLFCGAGGLSLGFEQAGFSPGLGLDDDDRAAAAYRLNFPSAVTIAADASCVNGDELMSTAGLDSCAVVAGGPPCAAFSVGGQHLSGDERRSLVDEFGRIVREIAPQYFVMENVPGILSATCRDVVEQFVCDMESGGYEVAEPWVLNATEFGVPQRRRRVFVAGCRRGLLVPSTPVPSGKASPTARDAIGDLALVHTEQHGGNGKPREPLRPRSDYAARMSGIARDPNDRSQPRPAPTAPTGSERVKHSPDVEERFRQVQPGKPDPISRFIRLHPDQPAPTIRAGTLSEHGSHTAPRPIHYEQPRCITVREAARLQSMPDWFRVDKTKWRGYMQVGNAVPPLLGRAVADSILDAMFRPRDALT